MSGYSIVLLSSMTIFFSYVIYAIFTLKQIPNSISETYYLLNAKSKGKGILFSIALFLAAGTLLPIWLDYTVGTNFQWLVFFACAGTIFVAFTPKYADKLEGAVHVGGALTACISAVAWTVTAGTWWISLICFGVFILYMVLFKKLYQKTFFLEVATLLSVYLSLIYLL